ncbi:MAG: response regulator transcription factor [Propionivibrio sp.]|uniref:Response regulator transcription factor n=1 Tax=Candidatus Propionivibrio dominans TaxID=2954373 RepID=A0A9D7FDG5_9RHOO|nr:response regulator transcription factor [Candidatus Propionivibrio dominans]
MIPGTPLSCVLLADRHHGLTEGVRGLLETSFGTVVMVADEASLLEGAIRLRPDVAVVDLSLSRSGSLSWLLALRQRCPELKVIVLSVHDEQSVRRAVMEAGADAFVLKRAIASDLLNAVDAVRRSRNVEVSSDNSRPAQEPGIHTGFQEARMDAKSSSEEWKP